MFVKKIKIKTKFQKCFFKIIFSIIYFAKFHIDYYYFCQYYEKNCKIIGLIKINYIFFTVFFV